MTKKHLKNRGRLVLPAMKTQHQLQPTNLWDASKDTEQWNKPELRVVPRVCSVIIHAEQGIVNHRAKDILVNKWFGDNCQN